MREQVPEECTPHSRKVGGATRTAEMVAQPRVIQSKREGGRRKIGRT